MTAHEVRTAMAHTPEWLKRGGVAVLAMLWLVHGYSYLFISDGRRWAPDLVGWLFIAASVFSGGVAWRPSWRLGYQLAACFTSTALVARLASLIVGLINSSDRDAGLIACAAAASTGVIMFLWWWFWIYMRSSRGVKGTASVDDSARGNRPMGIESIATGTVTGLLALVFVYVFRRTKDADDRRDEGSDMVRAGLEAELARANARADGLVGHYEGLLTEQHRRHQAEIERLTEQWERDRKWLNRQAHPANGDETPG